MKLFKATEQDVQTIHDIVRVTVTKVYPNYYPEDVVNFFLNYHSPDSIEKAVGREYVLLAKLGEKTIGTGSLFKNEIKRVFVLPEYQNSGCGSLLLDRLEQRAEKAGYATTVLDSSFPAYNMYLKRGYEPIKYERIITPKRQVLCYNRMAKMLCAKGERTYDVILFDLDGTLTDPKEGITKSVQYALASFGINEPNLESLIKFIGPPLKESFWEYYGFNDEEGETAIKKYREYFSKKGLFENRVYPAMADLLAELSEREKTLIVATSKPTVYAERILNHFRIREYFELVVGSNLDGSRVVKSEVIEYVLDKVKVSSDKRIVMVGDRKYDIIGAKEGGIDSIGVLYGYGSSDELKKAMPTYLAESVKTLRDILV